MLLVYIVDVGAKTFLTLNNNKNVMIKHNSYSVKKAPSKIGLKWKLTFLA